MRLVKLGSENMPEKKFKILKAFKYSSARLMLTYWSWHNAEHIEQRIF